MHSELSINMSFIRVSKIIRKVTGLLCGLVGILGCQQVSAQNLLSVNKAVSVMTIDGMPSEQSWHKANWHDVDQHIIGEYPAPEDFSAQYKLLWDESFLYVLVKLYDDVLYDANPNPLVRYWDDDCLEVFVDEDNSKGEHLANFNAFAYHIALDNQVVDLAPQVLSQQTPQNKSQKNQNGSQAVPMLFNDHIDSIWRRSSEAGFPIYWEIAVKLFSHDYVHPTDIQEKRAALKTYRVKNYSGKKLGFMLAYCDNDGSEIREHFIGSTAITPVNGDKNLGYITADVFDTLILVNDTQN